MDSDSPTAGEMWRRQNDMRDEMRAGFAAVNGRLDKMPTSDLWDAKFESIREDVNELKALQAQVRQARQWAISGVVIPLAGVLIALVVLLQGWNV